ncbi:MAG: type II toxin-antitoxin system ParD family antitoxin [Ghiorsea sp.]
MNFSLTPNLEQFVRDRAVSGDYNNASEVVREAIRLLKRTEEQRALKLEYLRAAIQGGVDDIEQGNVIPINSDKELDDFFGKL